MSTLVNVVDVEATCWNGPPPAGEVNEIIEIGVCVVDTGTWERVDRGRILVRPTASRVSPFCTELTGLTQLDVDGGRTFEAACRELRTAFAAEHRPWASWGGYDRRQFARQCAATGVEYPFGAVHVNVKELFARARGLRRGVGMAKALTLAGLPLEGRHHRGDDDAWNIGALVIHLAAGGWPLLAAEQA